MNIGKLAKASRRRWAAALCFGAVACGGGGSLCSGHKPQPPKPEESHPAQPKSPEPPVTLREFLFPPRSCQSALRRVGGHEVETLDYRVEGDRITLTQHTTTKTETHVYVVAADGIHRDGSLVYPLTARELDLLAPRQRIVNVTDTVSASAGDLSPCITTLSRRDQDLILRTYETWCRGVGLARVDRSLGKTRVISELATTTCR